MATSTVASERETTSRRAKAFAIYLRLTSLGITADKAAHYTDEQWKHAGTAAERRAPGPVTQRIVVEMLAASERERALCVYCGMGDPDGEPGVKRKPSGHLGRCSQ